MDNADSKLERRDKPVCNTFGKPAAERQPNQQFIYTEFLKPSI